jgi:hypothetical protein
MGLNTMGFSTPVMAQSEVASWTFTARFNLFEDNKGGIFIVTGMENTVASTDDWAYHGKTMQMPATVKINYNQFRAGAAANTHQYDIALVNLAKTSNFVGPLTTSS